MNGQPMAEMPPQAPSAPAPHVRSVGIRFVAILIDLIIVALISAFYGPIRHTDLNHPRECYQQVCADRIHNHRLRRRKLINHRHHLLGLLYCIARNIRSDGG